MTDEVQSWLAIGVVVLTLVVFAWRIVSRRRKKAGKPGCGGGCDCG